MKVEINLSMSCRMDVVLPKITLILSYISNRNLGWSSTLSMSSAILKGSSFWAVRVHNELKTFSKPFYKQTCCHPDFAVPLNNKVFFFSFCILFLVEGFHLTQKGREIEIHLLERGVSQNLWTYIKSTIPINILRKIIRSIQIHCFTLESSLGLAWNSYYCVCVFFNMLSELNFFFIEIWLI